MANVDLRKIISARDQLEGIIVREAAEELVRILDPKFIKIARTRGNTPGIWFRQSYADKYVTEHGLVGYMKTKSGYEFKEEDVLVALNYLMREGKVKKEMHNIGSAHNEHDEVVYSLKP